jgi:hypothetical protein
MIKNIFDSLSIKDKQSFLTEFPFLLEGWFSGVAMGPKFEVDSSTSLTVRWGTKAFRKFLFWMTLFANFSKHEDKHLFRLVSIPATNKDNFKLIPGKNMIHSWTVDAAVCRNLYSVAYKRYKQSKKWDYLIVSTKMPGNRIALTYSEAKILCEWTLKNLTTLHSAAQLHQNGLFNESNVTTLWKSLLKRLNVKLISSQKEVICIGKQPLMVSVIERVN